MLNMPTYDELVGGQTLEHYCAGCATGLAMGVLFLCLRYLTGVVSSLRGELRRCPRFGSMRERPSQIASIEADSRRRLWILRFPRFDQVLEPAPHGESLPILEEHRHEFLRLFQLSLAREKSALATVLRPPG